MKKCYINQNKNLNEFFKLNTLPKNIKTLHLFYEKYIKENSIPNQIIYLKLTQTNTINHVSNNILKLKIPITIKKQFNLPNNINSTVNY